MIRSTVLHAIAFLPAVLVLGACSNPLSELTEKGSSSCDFRSAPTPEQRCIDYTSVGLGQTTFEATCQNKKAAFGERCDRAGAIGGCNAKNTDGQDNDETSWYYATPDVKSVEDVQKLCGIATFVTP